MECLFIEYPKCTTCQKAKKWLEEKGVAFQDRHIKEQNPTKDELKQWHEKSGMDIKKFFNTSGMLYKEMKLKERLPEMSLEEKYELLSTDGMLVKRPLLVTKKGVLTGFKPEEWEKLLKE
ncbi:arsenate reductase family protein [Roseburia sp. 499]|uniref:arsenate reductase family protein n=1 Tax=Roseburia sp. 499 TaxID=1261634 RepID=UPI000952D58C|nr:arsenate reductase family protein [Roseburia sp. 499]WVK69539.1 arsenate reductase family protein [Roseburia sp. 499]